MRARLVLFGAVGGLAATLGFWTFSPRWAVEIVRLAGYYSVAVCFALWAYSLWKIVPWRECLPWLRRGGWITVVGIVGLTAFLLRQERPGFKVVMDEVLLVSTSFRMHDSREASTLRRGYTLSEQYVPMTPSMIDKRPLFFPFLLSLVHDATGYRVENAFALNAGLLAVLFGLVYWVARRLSGTAGGWVAVALLATVPLLVQSGWSAGFEILNLVMITATIGLGMVYAGRPGPDTAAAFVLAGVLLAQVRYESALFVVPVGLVVAWVWLTQRRVDLPWRVLSSPLFLIIYPLQQRVVEDRPRLLQLADRPSASGMFSFDYFSSNLGHALNYFLSTDQSLANSHLVFAAGLIGGGFFWMQLLRRPRTLLGDRERAVFTGFALALHALGIVLLCYFWGMFDDLITTRLSLPLQLGMVLLFVVVWPSLVNDRRRWSALLVVCAAYLAFWTLPTLHRRAYIHVNVATQSVEWLRRYANEHPLRDSLVIDPTMAPLWPILQVPVVTLEGLAARAEGIVYHYQRGTFRDYLLVRIFRPSAHSEPITAGPWRICGDSITTERVDRVQLRADYVLEMHRVTQLDLEAFRAWAAHAKRTFEATTQDENTASRSTVDEEEFIGEWLRQLP